MKKLTEGEVEEGEGTGRWEKNCTEGDGRSRNEMKWRSGMAVEVEEYEGEGRRKEKGNWRL